MLSTLLWLGSFLPHLDCVLLRALTVSSSDASPRDGVRFHPVYAGDTFPLADTGFLVTVIECEHPGACMPVVAAAAPLLSELHVELCSETLHLAVGVYVCASL